MSSKLKAFKLAQVVLETYFETKTLPLSYPSAEVEKRLIPQTILLHVPILDLNLAQLYAVV